MKEAYRLLNKSIIRVEQPDVHLDEEEEEELMTEEEQRAMEVDAAAGDHVEEAGERPTVNGEGRGRGGLAVWLLVIHHVEELVLYSSELSVIYVCLDVKNHG